MFLFYIPSLLTSSGFPIQNNLYNNEYFPDTDSNIHSRFGLNSTTSIGSPPSGWVIFSVTSSNTSTDFYINGVLAYQETTLIDSSYYNNTFGWSLGGFNKLKGTLAEVLVFNEALTNDKRVLLEGYIANKWSVTSLLPNGHKFISGAPTIIDFNNLITDTIVMDIDASITENFVFDLNSNILSINNLLTTESGTPILQTNPDNNKVGIFLNNSSLIPTLVGVNVLDNTKQFSIFTVGYINTTTNTNPTLLGTYSTNKYYIYIREFSDYNNQLAITIPYPGRPDLPNIVKGGPLLTNLLSNGIQNINNNTTNSELSVYINGNFETINTNTITVNDTYSLNFYLGGNSSDIESFVENSYIHKVLIYNIKIDDVLRMQVEGKLALDWNINTNNPLIPINKLTTYTGINTLLNIILKGWTLPVTEVYVAYNTSPLNLDNLVNLGPVTLINLNNSYSVSFPVIFTTPNTYTFHILDEFNVEYIVVSQSITVSDLSINTDSTINIINNDVFNVTLLNWDEISKNIGLYSNQISDFDLYIGTSSSDPSPTYVTNVPIEYENDNYILSVTGLINVVNKYLYYRKTINSVVVSIPPILISFIIYNLSIDHNYGILNISETYTITINASINPFTNEYSSVYLYHATIPNATFADLTFMSVVSVTGNTLTLPINSLLPKVYFYISTGVDYTGKTSYTEAIHFVDINTLSMTLDTYDINTNTRNVILNNWTPYFSQITNLNVLAGSANDYTGQTLLKTIPVREFIPSDIPFLNMWLDASSSSYFTFTTGSNISQWSDRSDNNNNATSTVHPVYDTVRKGVLFNINNYFNLPNGTIPYNDQDYHIFIVITPVDTTSSSQMILGSLKSPVTKKGVHKGFFS